MLFRNLAGISSNEVLKTFTKQTIIEVKKEYASKIIKHQEFVGPFTYQAKFLVLLAVGVLTFPYPLVNPFMAKWTFSRFLSLMADQFRTPSIFLEPVN